MEPVGMFKPMTTRPLSQWSKGGFGGVGSRQFVVAIRDNFALSTWLLFGAAIQSLLVLLLPTRFALTPAILILTYRFIDTILITANLKKNPYLEGVIPGKITAQIPDSEGRFSKEPSNEGVCVFLISARANHPLGLFAPGFKELGDHFVRMFKQLERNPEEFGFLGASSWLNASDRTSKSEAMTVAYFRSVSHLHAFAHSPIHRDGWTWWNKNLAKLPHISIMHEVYQVPKSNWENVYVNCSPTGFAATTFLARKEPGEQEWVHPIIDARKGRLRSSAGRMGRDAGDGNEKYIDDPYADTE